MEWIQYTVAAIVTAVVGYLIHYVKSLVTEERVRELLEDQKKEISMLKAMTQDQISEIRDDIRQILELLLKRG